MTDLNALVSQDALAMTRRMEEAAESGDADLQLHWAQELAMDAILRGATGELSTEQDYAGNANGAQDGS